MTVLPLLSRRRLVWSALVALIVGGGGVYANTVDPHVILSSDAVDAASSEPKLPQVVEPTESSLSQSDGTVSPSEQTCNADDNPQCVDDIKQQQTNPTVSPQQQQQQQQRTTPTVIEHLEIPSIVEEEDEDEEDWEYWEEEDEEFVEYEEEEYYDENEDELGVLQVGSEDPVIHRKSLERIEEATKYMNEVIHVDPQYENVRYICKNKYAECAVWAAEGECDANPNFMHLNCAPFCQTCEKMHIDYRCPLDPNATDALYPGDLNPLFEHIVTAPEYQQYQPIVLSRPDYAKGDGPTTANYSLGMWLVQFDNMSTPEECQRLIELGALEGYERSADVGEELEDGTYNDSINEGRTSTNAVS